MKNIERVESMPHRPNSEKYNHRLSVTDVALSQFKVIKKKLYRRRRRQEGANNPSESHFVTRKRILCGRYIIKSSAKKPLNFKYGNKN